MVWTMKFSLSVLCFLVSQSWVTSQVFQPLQLAIMEGKKIQIFCHQNVTSHNTMSWYKQDLEDQRTLFTLGSGYTGMTPVGEFQMEVDPKSSSTNLIKAKAELRDAAVYYCAVYGNKVTFGSGTRLLVLPYLEDSPPSIYELRPDASAGGEKKDKAACLITDYFPNPLKVKSKEGEKEVEVNGSVVVVKEEDAEKGTGSYGIVLWGDKDDNFHCAASDKNGQKFESNTADDPGTCLAESGDNGAFETDERLNLLSLTVLGLRVVFLKSVAFNLLLTFRLWSRGG